MNYTGNTKLIQKHLGFLETDYGLKFTFQTFESYNGFYGPIDTYSFYNKAGCFTLHNIVQKGEWGWFTSNKFSTNQYELLEKEINQGSYIGNRCLFFCSTLKKLSNIIKSQIDLQGCFFDIPIKYQ